MVIYSMKTPLSATIAFMVSATLLVPTAAAKATNGPGPCYIDANTMRVTGLSAQTAQDMYDHPSKYVNIPWCDSTQGVFLMSDIDANGNHIIDALESTPAPTPVTPVPTATATPAPTATPTPTKSATPSASPSNSATPSPSPSVVPAPTPTSSPSIKLAAAKGNSSFSISLALTLLALIVAASTGAWWFIRNQKRP